MILKRWKFMNFYIFCEEFKIIILEKLSEL
jgi:hypothetical protein